MLFIEFYMQVKLIIAQYKKSARIEIINIELNQSKVEKLSPAKQVQAFPEHVAAKEDCLDAGPQQATV